MADTGTITTGTAAITFSGLGSGIDFASLVDKLVEAERYQINQLEDWKSEWEAKIEAFQLINTKLSQLQTIISGMDTRNEFLVLNANTTNESVMGITADGTANAGSYDIHVGQLAKADKWTHSGHADVDTTAVTNTEQTFEYTYDGTNVSLTVTAGTTLEELRDLINNDPANPGVTASILNDGSGGASAYHLVLAGDDTGDAYDITGITHTLDNYSGGADGGFTQTQEAQDAWIQIDGYPSSDTGSTDPNDWIRRETNTISDAIDGLTFSLTGTGSTTVSINPDKEAIKEKITQFVDTFNEIRSTIKELTKYEGKTTVSLTDSTEEDTGDTGILIGNYAVYMVQSQLSNIIGSTASGFRTDSDTYSSLAQIGFKTDVEDGSATQGLLTIDMDALDDALDNDLKGVADLFAASYEGRSVGTDMTFSSSIDGITKAGSYEVRFNYNGGSPTGQMRVKGTSEWHTATWDASSGTLTGSAGYPESGLVVKINDPTADRTGEVDIKLGIAGMLDEQLKNLSSPTRGPLYVLEDNYNVIIDNIDEKIAREEKRLLEFEQREREKYGRLEQLLSELNGQSQSIQSAISQLG